jgi:hypothetical protein
MPEPTTDPNDEILKLLDDLFKVEQDAAKGRQAERKLKVLGGGIDVELGDAVIEEEPPVETGPIPGSQGIDSGEALTGDDVTGVGGPLGSAPEGPLGPDLKPQGIEKQKQDLEIARVADELGLPPELLRGDIADVPQTVDTVTQEPTLTEGSVRVRQPTAIVNVPVARAAQGVEQIGALATAENLTAQLEEDEALAGLSAETQQFMKDKKAEIDSLRDEEGSGSFEDPSRTKRAKRGREFYRKMKEARKRADDMREAMVKNPVDRDQLLSTPGNRILAAISVFAGGVLSVHMNGRNPGLEALNSAIAADVNAQVARHNQRKDVAAEADDAYSRYLELFQNQEAAITASYATEALAAAEKAKEQILTQAMPAKRRAEALDALTNYVERSGELWGKAAELGFKELALRAKLDAAKARGSGSKKVKDPTLLPTDLQLRGLVREGVTPFKFSPAMQEKYGLPPEGTSIPTGIAELSQGGRKEIRTQLSNATRQVQNLDDLGKTILSRGDELLQLPWEDDAILARQQADQIIQGIVERSQKLSDQDRPIVARALAAQLGTLELRDMGTIVSMISSAQDQVVSDIRTRVQTVLPDSVTFDLSVNDIAGSRDFAVQGGSANVKDAPSVADSFAEIDNLDASNVTTEAGRALVTDILNDLDTFAGVDHFTSAVVVGRLGQRDKIEKKLTQLEKIAAQLGDREGARASVIKAKILKQINQATTKRSLTDEAVKQLGGGEPSAADILFK